MVVVTFSGVPRVGGRVMGGRTGCRGVVTKVSLMRLVRREDLPTSSSPQMHIRTWMVVSVWWCYDSARDGKDIPVAMLQLERPAQAALLFAVAAEADVPRRYINMSLHDQQHVAKP